MIMGNNFSKSWRIHMIVSTLGAIYEPPPTPEEQFERDVVQWMIDLAEQQKDNKIRHEH